MSMGLCGEFYFAVRGYVSCVVWFCVGFVVFVVLVVVFGLEFYGAEEVGTRVSKSSAV